MAATLACSLAVAVPALPAQSGSSASSLRALEGLDAPDPAQRFATLRELATGTVKHEVVEAVALMLADPEPKVRRAAVDTLVALRGSLRISRDQLNAIVAAQPGADPVRFFFTPGRRAPADTTGIDMFVEKLHAPKSFARRDAVVALCGLGEAAASHQPAVLAMLNDPDSDVRTAVALKAGLLGWNPALVAAMAEAIKDPSAEVRRAAAATLGEHDDQEAVAALRTAIQDPDVRVRAEVLRSLAGCGNAGTSAGSEIAASTRDREITVCIAALDAVRRLALTTPRAVSECIRCLGDVRHEVVVAALQAIASQGRAAGPAMPTLLRLVHHDRAPVRSAALEAALAVAEDRQRGAAVLLCIEALTDGTREVRDAAELLLRRFVYGQPGPVPLPPMVRLPR